MGLEDQSQVLHRLIRRIVEAESAVGVRRDYRLNISTQIHRNRLYSEKKQPVDTCPDFRATRFSPHRQVRFP